MEISLVDFDKKEMLNKLWVACRTCYSEKDPKTLLDEARKLPTSKKVSLVEKIFDMNHLSTSEHVNFTFLICGISRAAAMQFLRHRHQSPSMQSQRYCVFKDDFPFVIPPSIEKNMEAREGYIRTMRALADVYTLFLNLGIPAEDARYVLPNSAAANLTVTLNLRELMWISHERLCVSAQWEIRELVQKMVKLVVAEFPFLKKYLVSKCEVLGYCTEDKTKTCGKRKHKTDIICE